MVLNFRIRRIEKLATSTILLLPPGGGSGVGKLLNVRGTLARVAGNAAYLDNLGIARFGNGFPLDASTPEGAMNAKKTLKLIGGALILVASFNAWSQSSEPAAMSAESGISTATQGTSKSAIRKANRALSKKVLQALSKGGVDTSGINVLVKGSAISLAGNVPDASQVEKAGSIAKGVSGVTSVKNALAIKEAGR